jgi:hypothetical protein
VVQRCIVEVQLQSTCNNNDARRAKTAQAMCDPFFVVARVTVNKKQTYLTVTVIVQFVFTVNYIDYS